MAHKQWLLVLLASLAGSTATADPRHAAQDLYRKGTRDYDLGHYEEAAREYEAAFKLKEEPSLLFDIGQAYRSAGDHVRALAAYRGYLRRFPDAPNRAETERRIHECDAAVQQQATDQAARVEGQQQLAMAHEQELQRIRDERLKREEAITRQRLDEEQREQQRTSSPDTDLRVRLGETLWNELQERRIAVEQTNEFFVFQTQKEGPISENEFARRYDSLMQSAELDGVARHRSLTSKLLIGAGTVLTVGGAGALIGGLADHPNYNQSGNPGAVLVYAGAVALVLGIPSLWVGIRRVDGTPQVHLLSVDEARRYAVLYNRRLEQSLRERATPAGAQLSSATGGRAALDVTRLRLAF